MLIGIRVERGARFPAFVKQVMIWFMANFDYVPGLFSWCHFVYGRDPTPSELCHLARTVHSIIAASPDMFPEDRTEDAVNSFPPLFQVSLLGMLHRMRILKVEGGGSP